MSRVAGRKVVWLREIEAIQGMFNDGISIKEVAAYYGVGTAWVYKLVIKHNLAPPVNAWTDPALSTRAAAKRGTNKVRAAKLNVFKSQANFSPAVENLTVQSITWNITCPVTGGVIDYHATKGEACYPMLHVLTLNVISKQAYDLLQASKGDPTILRRVLDFVGESEPHQEPQQNQ